MSRQPPFRWDHGAGACRARRPFLPDKPTATPDWPIPHCVACYGARVRGSRCKQSLGDAKVAGLLVLLLGASACELFRGYVRQVQLVVPPPETCVRTSLSEVPGITVYKQGRLDGGFWFIWTADQLTQGTVSVHREDSGAILLLDTGWLNSCLPEALARGRVIMNSLYERLRINCGDLPELSKVKEERVRACGD